MQTTATATATRFFRFGGILHQDHEAVAHTLTALEDRLNAAAPAADWAAVLERVYFIPVIVTDDQYPIHPEIRAFDAAEKKIILQVHVAPSANWLSVLLAHLREVAGAHLGVVAFLENMAVESEGLDGVG